MEEKRTEMGLSPELLMSAERPASRISRLNQWHLRAVEMYLLGLSATEIGLALNRSREQVSLLINQPLFQQEVSRRRVQQQRQTDAVLVERTTDVMDRLEQLKSEAIGVMEEAMSDPDTKTRITAAKDILDRAGVGQRSGSVQVSAQITADKLQVLIVALQESRGTQENEAA